MMSEEKTITKVPLWLATAITVMVALIPAFFFGGYAFTAWLGFVVWAQYFKTGDGRPGNWKIISPCLLAGSLNGALYIAVSVFLTRIFGRAAGEGEIAAYAGWAVGALVTTPLLICPMQASGLLMKGSLSYFNGYAMVFAAYFTASYPRVGPLDHPYWPVLLSLIWVNLMGQYGWLIGYLNIKLTFPRTVMVKKQGN